MLAVRGPWGLFARIHFLEERYNLEWKSSKKFFIVADCLTLEVYLSLCFIWHLVVTISPFYLTTISIFVADDKHLCFFRDLVFKNQSMTFQLPSSSGNFF